MNKWLMGGGIAVLAAIGVILTMRGLQSTGNGNGNGHRNGNGAKDDALREIEELADQLMIENPGWTRAEALAEAARILADRILQDIYDLPDTDNIDVDIEIIRDAEETAKDTAVMATELIATIAVLKKEKEALRKKAAELENAAKETQKEVDRIKGDERILGDGDFVERVLKVRQEQMERRYEYQAKGYDFDWLVSRVARLFDMKADEVIRPGRYPDTVKARSALCYWAKGSWVSAHWN